MPLSPPMGMQSLPKISLSSMIRNYPSTPCPTKLIVLKRFFRRMDDIAVLKRFFKFLDLPVDKQLQYPRDPRHERWIITYLRLFNEIVTKRK